MYIGYEQLQPAFMRLHVIGSLNVNDSASATHGTDVFFM